MAHENAWIGIDLDGTLAHYDYWRGPTHIGEPIVPMMERVKDMIASGKTVKIFTARVSLDPVCSSEEMQKRVAEVLKADEAITAWCKKHGLPELEATCNKDFHMVELYDDRAKQVLHNTGILLEDEFQRQMTVLKDMSDIMTKLSGHLVRVAGVAKAFLGRFNLSSLPSDAEEQGLALWNTISEVERAAAAAAA